jgi:hypothetical protein
MRRRLLIGAVVGALVATLALWGRPDTGPDVHGAARDVEAEIARRAPQQTLPEIPRSVSDLKRLARERAAEPEPDGEPEPGTAPDPPGTVYDADLLGVARAARSRKDGILACLRREEDAGTALPQRVGIHFALLPDGDASSRAVVTVDGKDAPTAIADACLADLFSSVPFDPVDEPGEYVWPFPTAWLDAPPPEP